MNPCDFRSQIVPADRAAAVAARERIDGLIKPVGSLGRIEELAVQLCAIAGGLPRHNYERRAILIGAGDHGVAADGVSAYPPEVTAQMVGGFLAGFAAISALRARCGPRFTWRISACAKRCRCIRASIDVNAGLRNRRTWPTVRRSRATLARIRVGSRNRGVRRARREAAPVRRDRARRDGHRQHDECGGDRRGVHRPPARAVVGRGTGRRRRAATSEGRSRRRGARALQRIHLGRDREPNGRLRDRRVRRRDA